MGSDGTEQLQNNMQLQVILKHFHIDAFDEAELLTHSARLYAVKS